MYFDLNDNIDDLTRPRLFDREPCVSWMLKHVSGTLWDVGCNIGQFAVPASLLAGNKVVAFDISPRSCRLLAKTAHFNKLPVVIVNQALSTVSFSYAVPASSRPTEDTGGCDLGSIQQVAMTFMDAARLYGVPALVKMDIEGGEKLFLESSAWKQWIVENGVYWIFELHSFKGAETLIWDDVPSLQMDETHYLCHANREEMNKLALAWRQVPIPHG